MTTFENNNPQIQDPFSISEFSKKSEKIAMNVTLTFFFASVCGFIFLENSRYFRIISLFVLIISVIALFFIERPQRKRWKNYLKLFKQNEWASSHIEIRGGKFHVFGRTTDDDCLVTLKNFPSHEDAVKYLVEIGELQFQILIDEKAKKRGLRSKDQKRNNKFGKFEEEIEDRELLRRKGLLG